MRGEPIVKGNLQDRVISKVKEIAEALLDYSKPIDNWGLMGGQAGIALFLFYYSRFCNEEKYAEKGFELIERIFEAINNEFQYHTFAGGLAGIAWTVDHLNANAFIRQDDLPEILDGLDPFLYAMMMKDMREGNYDYLHAAMGLGLYFQRRLTNEKRSGYLSDLLIELEKHSEKDGNGLKWLSIVDHEKGTKGYNLSLSHGLSSIILILTKIYAAGIEKDRSRSIISRSIDYLLRQAYPEPIRSSIFPSWVNAQGIPPSPGSRLGWCYGDIGIGMALWRAGEALGNNDWKNRGLETLLSTTQRRDLEENSICDAGICHGSAGLVHIFNRIFQETGIEDFRNVSIYWTEKTLDFASHPDGIAGYKAYRMEKYGGWVADAGFLEGVAGIGIVLLATVSSLEPLWDQALLLC